MKTIFPYLGVCVVLGFVTIGLFAKRQPPPDGDSPLTKTKLANTRLDHHRADPSVEWIFKEKSFVLFSRKPPLPHSLTKAILGENVDVKKIEGSWDLIETQGKLVLKDIQADGKKAKNFAVLGINPRGVVRVQILDLQYNLHRGKLDESP